MNFPVKSPFKASREIGNLQIHPKWPSLFLTAREFQLLCWPQSLVRCQSKAGYNYFLLELGVLIHLHQEGRTFRFRHAKALVAEDKGGQQMWIYVWGWYDSGVSGSVLLSSRTDQRSQMLTPETLAFCNIYPLHGLFGLSFMHWKTCTHAGSRAGEMEIAPRLRLNYVHMSQQHICSLTVLN